MDSEVDNCLYHISLEAIIFAVRNFLCFFYAFADPLVVRFKPSPNLVCRVQRSTSHPDRRLCKSYCSHVIHIMGNMPFVFEAQRENSQQQSVTPANQREVPKEVCAVQRPGKRICALLRTIITGRP